MDTIKEAIGQSLVMKDGQRKYTDIDICTTNGLPARVFYRWLAVYKACGKLPATLPKKGKPSLLPFDYEVRLATWVNLEAMCQRSVAIPVIIVKAKKVMTCSMMMMIMIMIMSNSYIWNTSRQSMMKPKPRKPTNVNSNAHQSGWYHFGSEWQQSVSTYYPSVYIYETAPHQRVSNINNG
jgi:hypothetical protein